MLRMINNLYTGTRVRVQNHSAVGTIVKRARPNIYWVTLPATDHSAPVTIKMDRHTFQVMSEGRR